MKFAQFSAMSGFQRVDSEAGIIYGVSCMTVGEAAGKHEGTFIDALTLSQLQSLSSNFPDGIKVKLSMSKEHDGSVGQIVGSLKAFRIDGNKWRADLHLLKSDAHFSKLVDLAKTLPNEFGLSANFDEGQFSFEKQGGKNLLRCSGISSMDIVEYPATNAGLFSGKKDEEDGVVYAADGKTHTDKCTCKECMSKSSKTKSMSALFAKVVGLPDTATEQEIADALALRLTAAKPADLTGLTAKIEAATLQLSKLESAGVNALALSKKSEIDNLMAEAGRNGQVVPLETAELYEVKDGVCSIKMEPMQLSKIISRIPKGGISLSKTRTFTAPVNDAGKQFDRHTPEGREQLKQWCLSKQAENAPEIIRASRLQMSGNN